MKLILGGSAVDPNEAGCKKDTACTIVLLTGGTVEGKCTTIAASGMTPAQCGCGKDGYTSQPDTSCKPPVNL